MNTIKTEENYQQFRNRVNNDYRNIKLRLEELRNLYKDNFDDYSYLWLLSSLNKAMRNLEDAVGVMDGWLPDEDAAYYPFGEGEDNDK